MSDDRSFSTPSVTSWLFSSTQSCGDLLGRVNIVAETVTYIPKDIVKLSVVNGPGKDNPMAHSNDSKSIFRKVGYSGLLLAALLLTGVTRHIR